MFKGGNGKTTGPSNTPDKLNKIVEGTSIKGDVKTDSNFRIDGALEGTFESIGKLVIGVTGKIEGEITCANADIEGEFIGNIRVDGLLVLKATAKISGNVIAGKIAIENGAVFNATCKMAGAPVEIDNSFISEKKSDKKEKPEKSEKAEELVY